MYITESNDGECSSCTNDIFEIISEQKNKIIFGDIVYCKSCNNEGIINENGKIEFSEIEE
jgi:hypothetical protein